MDRFLNEDRINSNITNKIAQGEFPDKWLREVYEYMGVKFDIWVFLTIAIFIPVSGRVVYMFRVVRSAKKKGMDVQDVCLILDLLGCIARILYMLDPAVDDYGKPIGKIWPISIQALTLKLPQLFWVAAILFLILFWRDLEQRSQKLKKDASMKNLVIAVSLLVGLLVVVILPMTFLEAFEIGGQLLLTISNGFFALYILCLTVGGFNYARKLAKMCENLKSERGKEVIMKVRRTVIMIAFVALVGVLAIIWHSLYQSRIMNHLIFWFLINTFCEPLVAMLICYAVAPRSDTAKKWARRTRSTGVEESSANSVAEQTKV